MSKTQQLHLTVTRRRTSQSVRLVTRGSVGTLQLGDQRFYLPSVPLNANDTSYLFWVAELNRAIANMH